MRAKSFIPLISLLIAVSSIPVSGQVYSRTDWAERCLDDIMSVISSRLPESNGALTTESLEMDEESLVFTYSVADPGLYERFKRQQPQLVAAYSRSMQKTLDANGLLLVLLSDFGVSVKNVYCNPSRTDSISVIIPVEEYAKIIGNLVTDSTRHDAARNYLKCCFPNDGGDMSVNLTDEELIFSQRVHEKKDDYPKMDGREVVHDIIRDTYVQGLDTRILYDLCGFLDVDSRNILIFDDQSVSTDYSVGEIFEAYVDALEITNFLAWDKATSDGDIKVVYSDEGVVQHNIEHNDFWKSFKSPEFKGRDKNAFAKWVSGMLVYPENAKRYGVEGVVKLRFTIDEEGNVTDIVVLESACPSMDKEAVRVVSKSPKWTPAMADGQKVKCTFDFPVIFKLKSE